MSGNRTVERDGEAAGIAKRYGDMVYAAAWRQTRDRELAQDVMQGVFVVLLTKMRAGKGPEEARMAGWLLKVTRYVVKETRRASWRRRRRETAAAEGPAMGGGQGVLEIREALDAALLTLGNSDREIVARRYLRGESVEAVGAALDSEVHGKGWMEVGGAGRFREDSSLLRSPWTDGAAPFIDESFSEAWDGEKLRILYGPPHSTVRGQITADETIPEGRRIFGEDYSMQLMHISGTAANGREVYEYPLNPARLQKMQLAGRRVMMNGRETMELEVRYILAKTVTGKMREELERFARRYWFDAARGYALLGYEEELGEQPMEERVVDEVTEAASGVFYPMRARTVSYTRDHATGQWHLQMRDDFAASRVVANQVIDPTMFRIEFPAGLSVTTRGIAASQPATER